MTYGAIRSVLVASILSVLALVIGVFDYPTFLGIVIVGTMVFVGGFFTGNQPGCGGALITGFIGGVLVVLLSFVLFRLAADSGDSELEYLIYKSLRLSLYVLIGLPVLTALATFIMDKLEIN